MGWALHKQGNNTEALDFLERARKRGADPEIDLHVGEVQWALDDERRRAQTWAKALERWPDDEQLQGTHRAQPGSDPSRRLAAAGCLA